MGCHETHLLPNIYLMYGEYWYQMLPEDFYFDASEYQDLSVCALAIMSNNMDFFLLGNSFLKGYYSIHDMQDGYLGLVPHATSKKDFAEFGTIPTDVLPAAAYG